MVIACLWKQCKYEMRIRERDLYNLPCSIPASGGVEKQPWARAMRRPGTRSRVGTSMARSGAARMTACAAMTAFQMIQLVQIQYSTITIQHSTITIQYSTITIQYSTITIHT